MSAVAVKTGRGASLPASPTVIMWMLALCGTIVSLQQTMVVPLLPEFPVILGTSVDNSSWLVTATLLTGAVSTPVVSRLADMYGKRRMILVALSVMIAGSLLGAATSLLPVVVIARGMQGVGMALVPVGIAMMRDVLPADRVPLGVSLMSGTLAIGAGAGLPLAGWLAEHLDWHAIFWTTAILGIILLVAAKRVLPESQVRTGGRFDYLGALLATGALTMLLLVISKGGQWGWTSGPTLGALVLGVLLLGLWVPLELRVPNPLIDVRTAMRPAVGLVNICAVLTGFGMFANMLVTTQQLQLPTTTGFGLGLPVLESGLWMAPSALVFGLCAPLSAAMTNRFGARVTLLLGAGAMSVCYVLRAFFTDDLFQVVLGSMLVSVGTSLAFAAMPTLIMAAVPVTETAAANGLNTLLRSIGTSTSSATVAALAAANTVVIAGVPYPSEGALITIFWMAAGACALACLTTIPLFGMSDVKESEATPDEAVLARGVVVGADGVPVRTAVVTIVAPEGARLDWAQVDGQGEFNVSVPGTRPCLFVTSAEGWAPDARVVRPNGLVTIALRPTDGLHGRVQSLGGSSLDGVVVLTRQEGGVVATGRTETDGRFALVPPGPGGYVLSVVDRLSGEARASFVQYHGGAQRMDIELPGVAGGRCGLAAPGPQAMSPGG